ncbi:MAG: sugar phosphate isomerase/epimerase [Chloroflexota bacterium]|nr:sugar phosphate isomerase/epimerase [Chloroflexota bacterium]
MNRISFMSANYVARQLGYNMTQGWEQGDKATNAHFEPLETFPERFEELLIQVRSLGFHAMDIWTGHLNWRWATPEHIAAALGLLRQHGLSVSSLAGGFGSTPDEFESACRLAVALGTDILGGITPLLERDRESVLCILREYGVRLAVENHPERTPEDMLAKIGDGGGGIIGTAVDTGWYATHGYNAPRAIEALGENILHVHLKDIRAPGGHDTCRYGEGIVPVEECVRALQRLGYSGGISVEHEPEDRDPSEDVAASLRMLRAWLGQNVDASDK